jgi:short-subunit dehydrogenase
MKKIIICGTKKNSLSKIFKTFLKRKGFCVRLFSRNTTSTKSGRVFVLDLSKPNTFKNILPAHDISAIIFSQDSGTAFGDFDKLSYQNIQKFINSKILGSILFSRFLLEQQRISGQGKIKLIWTCGTYDLKPKNYMLYYITNSAIKSFVEELNEHYSQFIEAYYIITPFMSKTTVGILYNRTLNKKEQGENPKKLFSYLEKIMNDEIIPGVIMLNSPFVK